MTQEQSNLWHEGRALAREFNRYKTERETILRPSATTIAKMARILDISQEWIRTRLSFYANN